MTQFMNPYFQQQQPQYSTYQPYQNQVPTFRSQQTPTILGKYINNVEEIAPNEVPMDGTLAFFPKLDGSEIYAKFWDKEGKLNTIKFVQENTNAANTNKFMPEHENNTQNVPFSIPSKETNFITLDTILERLDEIVKLLDRKPNYNKRQEKRENQNGK